ncbi:MAG: putative metal-binding motif-containing protein, partial [Candidatus Saccharibacteria bacterium]|nr:putative metal-binding motif-containing protein [Candidatus Saccharibacteria bacterium]
MSRKFATVICTLFVIVGMLIILPAAAQAVCIDADLDGYGSPASIDCTYKTLDCDDTDFKVHPGAARICDGKDSDCDGRADSITDVDKDHDGAPLCIPTGGKADCNDNDPAMFPKNIEAPLGDPICADNKDNDCDGKIDAADTGCKSACVDVDGDGYGNPGSTFCPNGSALDCNDTNSNINPGKTDADCNGIDENCSGTADGGYVTTVTSCGVGACTGAGQLTCQAGAVVDTCTPGAPQTEGPLGDP